MSVVQNPIVGRSSGKFSNAIFAKWKDKNTLRSKPLVVVQPNTLQQLEQRSVFAAAVRYARFVIVFLRYSLRSFSVSMSEFNSFIKLNISLIDRATKKFAVATISQLRFALGSFSPLLDVTFVSASPSALVVTWDNIAIPPDYSDDMSVSFIVYNLTKDILLQFSNVENWVVGSATLTVDFAISDVVHVFAIANSTNLSNFSTSQYVGTRTVA